MGSADSHHDFRESTLPTPRTQSKTRPRTRPPPPAAAPALRRHLTDSPNRETARPLIESPSVARHRGAAMSARTILVALLVVLLLIAVGCGGGSGKEDNGSSLTFWTAEDNPDRVKATQAIINRFA